MESLFGPKREKEEPEAPDLNELRERDFREALQLEIENAEWAPQLFSVLAYLTNAELDGRSLQIDNIPLYKQLMARSIDVAGTQGNLFETHSSQGAVDMNACIQVGLEASRIIREHTAQRQSKNIPK